MALSTVYALDFSRFGVLFFLHLRIQLAMMTKINISTQSITQVFSASREEETKDTGHGLQVSQSPLSAGVLHCAVC